MILDFNVGERAGFAQFFGSIYARTVSGVFLPTAADKVFRVSRKGEKHSVEAQDADFRVSRHHDLFSVGK
jgi:hypothetical protein